MSVALDGPFIQALGYTRGRAFVERPGVGVLVVHSAEGATSAVDLGNFFARNANGSSHAGIGQDGGYAQYVNYGDTPWANPPLNQESDALETCGFAAWTREQWLAYPAMLDSIGKWIAWRAAVRGIPVVLLSAQDLLDGKDGVVDHLTVNNAFHKSNHWDVGYNFPWDVVMPVAQSTAQVPVQPAPVPVVVDYVGVWNAGYTVAQIKTTQTKLNQVGYDLVVDGIRGPLTQAAIRDFQSKHGLEVDALPGPKTQAALDAVIAGQTPAPNPVSPLTVDGIEGPLTVCAEQRTLKAAGHYAGNIDGIRGPQTISGEQAYLQAKGYYHGAVDAMFGPISIRAEQSYLRDLGYYTGAVDGIRGAGTKSALQQALNAGRF